MSMIVPLAILAALLIAGYWSIRRNWTCRTCGAGLLGCKCPNQDGWPK